MARPTKKIRFDDVDATDTTMQSSVVMSMDDDYTLYRLIFDILINMSLEDGTYDTMRWALVVYPSGTQIVSLSLSGELEDTDAECVLAAGCFGGIGETTFHPYTLQHRDINVQRKLKENDEIRLICISAASSSFNIKVDGIAFFKEV